MSEKLYFRRTHLGFALGIASMSILVGLGLSCSDPTGINTTPVYANGPDASVGGNSSSSAGGSSSGAASSSGGGSSSGTGVGSSSGAGSNSGAGGSGSSSGAPMVSTPTGLCPPPGAPTATLLTADGMHCIDPVSINKNCGASQEWIPNTPPIPTANLFKPLQHPFPECPFYRFGYQNFLIATQPFATSPDPTTAQGDPAIVTYQTIDDLFTKPKPLAVGALAPAGAHRGTALRSWLGDIKQAGQREIAIDKYGHSLYYGIQGNQAMADFIKNNGLDTIAGLTGYMDDPVKKFLAFPEGLVEFKNAWMDIDVGDGIPAQDNANYVQSYITTLAWVPTLSQDTMGNILENRDKPRQIQVALIATHVVYTIPGHPEFVWASFQHIDNNGNPDSAGQVLHNPTALDPNDSMDPEGVCAADAGAFVLCKAGTRAMDGNRALRETDLKLVPAIPATPADSAKQRFYLASSPTTLAQTSIYRLYPGSKSNQDGPDDDVVSLNANVDAVWALAGVQGTVDPNDRRMNYHLVGANWMDKPALYTINNKFQNLPQYNPLLAGPDAGTTVEQADERTALWASGVQAVNHDVGVNGTDSPFSILGGEERISSTSMESFTQSADKFFNCFTCHNTQAITANGTPSDKATGVRVLLKPGLLNVSHLLSQFVLENCPGGAGQPMGCPP